MDVVLIEIMNFSLKFITKMKPVMSFDYKRIREMRKWFQKIKMVVRNKQ